ncbi:DegT/DnrJ/EryC1/StrS family aminotransferase [Daejeonella rubra]|nr:DegT/DnrJ/EryC1/StrS family aminotransferase [Daejeonella rubra]
MIDLAEMIYTGRGSSALYAILNSITVTKKKILLPVNICEIVIPLIQMAGFIPVFYDVNPATGNSDLENIKAKYTGEESVLLAVHNFGAALEIDLISDWAKENVIFLIEDVCNALGATYKNVPAGNWGDAAIYSFGYSKIVELGFGGGLTVRDSGLRQKVIELISTFDLYSALHKEADHDFQSKLRNLRNDPGNQKPEIYRPLYDDYAKFLIYRLDNQNVTLIKDAIVDLDHILLPRYQKAMMYKNGISSSKISHIKEVPGQIFWRYNILVEPQWRDELLKLLIDNTIWASKWYPPVNQLFFEGSESGGYSGADLFSKRVINLFVDERFSIAEVKRTISLINQF